MLLRLDKYQRISTYSSLLHSCSLFRSSITPRSSHVFRTGFALSFLLTSRIEELVQFGLSNDRKHLNEAVYLSLGGGGEGRGKRSSRTPGAGLKINLFRTLGHHFGLKIRGAGCRGLSPGSAQPKLWYTHLCLHRCRRPLHVRQRYENACT